MARPARAAAVVALVIAVASTGAAADARDRAVPAGPLGDVVARSYPAARAAAAADDGSPTAAQARYDAARDLQEAAVVRVTLDCVPLRDAIRRYAAAEVDAAEAFDRLDRPARAAAAARSATAEAQIARRRAACRGTSRLEASAPASTSLPGIGQLPRTAFTTPTPRPDGALARRLAAIGAGFPGYAAISVTDLAGRRAASWNATARFPAASTVKLGVIAAALARYRGRERAAVAHDLRAIATWSSNLAANRLAARLGTAAVEGALHRLGATSSSYTGAYRAGSSRHGRLTEPPLVSQRVTTAHDLDSILRTLLRAASGWRSAIATAEVSRADARTALALLLGADGRGDNAGLVGPFVPGGIRVAQKNGWISSARHTAAIVFTTRGPVIVVVLTYREGLSQPAAQALGRQVVRAALG